MSPLQYKLGTLDASHVIWGVTMGHTPYLSHELLDEVLRGSAYTPVNTVFLSLITSLTSLGQNYGEVAPGEYTRQVVVFGAAANMRTSNTSAVSFSAATTPWGTVTHVGIHDAATAGNLLYWKALGNPMTVASSTIVSVAVGEFIVKKE